MDNNSVDVPLTVHLSHNVVIVVLVLLNVWAWLLFVLRSTRWNTLPAPASLPFQLIVARYDEDVSWLSRFPAASVHIYNKGKCLPASQAKRGRVHQLPNVGRESHTYLHHIVQHYDEIQDDVVYCFTQGRVGDHFVGSFESEFLQVTHCTRRSSTASFPFALDECLHVPADFVRKQKVQPTSIDFGSWFEKHICPNIHPRTRPLVVWWNGLFSVKGRYLRRRPKSFYEGLLEQLSHDVNPEVGHYFERSWFYILAMHEGMIA